jgi:hypothetical protein
MGFLALALMWPLLFLIIGFVFVSAWSVSGFLFAPAIILFFIIVFGLKGQIAGSGPRTELENLDRVRRGAATFSIALLPPMFVKYLLAVSGNDLSTMILGLIFGFGVIIWGMFIKHNKVLAYANSIGGALSIIYLYIQLWSLGQLAQIVATAFGLLVAIIVSVVKFREKLT